MGLLVAPLALGGVHFAQGALTVPALVSHPSSHVLLLLRQLAQVHL